jgi:hypothetical protein
MRQISYKAEIKRDIHAIDKPSMLDSLCGRLISLYLRMRKDGLL